MSSRMQIGNTLTITTMDDPVSVQAQYSPDMVTIHTTWQDGDLYMRTRESDDAAWSSWHKIVGENGDSAPAAFASPAQISVPCYSNGNVKAQKITSVFFSLKVGTNTATVTSCSDGTKPTGVTVQGRANNAVTITVGTSATASGLSAGVTFTVTGTYGGKTYSAPVTVALIGSTQGDVGKIGRFFYYAGEWNDLAQYAPNNDPSPSQIHDTWQDGDLYMRIRQSNETTWSSWHKIVGESEGETDFSFGISQYKTTANASTAPSDISSWSDTPLAVTTEKSYLWSKVQQKSWNESTQSYDVDSTTYIRLTVIASTDSFLVNDAQAPYFYYNYNYWVFNPETNGTYTKQDMGTPSSSSSNWKLMTSDFKYIITEAIFGAYAHFGSFIINGDWMISTNGTINGVLYVNGQNFTYNGETKPAYMWFDASNPNNNTGHNFLPNYAVDGRSGDSYQNNGAFKGIVTSNLSYSPTGTKTGNDDVILNPQSDKCGTFLISSITTVKNIYLPLASQYDGLEYNLIQAVYVNDEYKNCYINRSGSDQIYVPANNKLTAVTMFTLPPNMIVKLKSINGSWYAWM